MRSNLFSNTQGQGPTFIFLPAFARKFILFYQFKLVDL